MAKDKKIVRVKKAGVTLVALLVTVVIVLIIIAVGVKTASDTKIFDKTEEAANKYEESQARENLQLSLADLKAERYAGRKKLSEEYVDKYLTSKGYYVNGNTVISGRYKFMIDKEKFEIVSDLGIGELDNSIKIKETTKTNSDFTKGVIETEIEYDGTLTEITINNEKVDIPPKEAGSYTVRKEVDKNGDYIIIARDHDKSNMQTVKVTGITEDFAIGKPEDFIRFRDEVNKGRTYEGKVVKLSEDVDLSKICHKVDGTIKNDKSFEPISLFKGTFNGNNKEIKNLYINSDQNTGMFKEIDNATIKKLKVSGEVKTTANCAGGVICDASNSKIENVENKINVSSKVIAGGVLAETVKENSKIEITRCVNHGDINIKNDFSYCYTGGVLGYSYKAKEVKITSSYNTGKVEGYTNKYTTFTAGILGESDGAEKCIIENCYNTGEMKSNGGYAAGAIAFINNFDRVVDNNYVIKNFYNAGKLTGDEIAGNVAIDAKVKVNIEFNNTYFTDTCGAYYGSKTRISLGGASKISEAELKGKASALGPDFKNDTRNINNGYPILKWQED